MLESVILVGSLVASLVSGLVFGVILGKGQRQQQKVLNEAFEYEKEELIAAVQMWQQEVTPRQDWTPSEDDLVVADTKLHESINRFIKFENSLG